MESLGEAGISTVCLGVADEISINAGFAEVVREFGRIDVLVNEAGYGPYGGIEYLPMDVRRRQFELNAFGADRIEKRVLT